MSNRGACDFLAKPETRKFELTETFYGVGGQTMPVCFSHYVVSVRGKFCWTVAHNDDDIITKEDGSIYADCIRRVLDGIDLYDNDIAA